MDVAIAEGPQRKIFRAKKTMKISDRQQLEYLNTLQLEPPCSVRPPVNGKRFEEGTTTELEEDRRTGEASGRVDGLACPVPPPPLARSPPPSLSPPVEQTTTSTPAPSPSRPTSSPVGDNRSEEGEGGHRAADPSPTEAHKEEDGVEQMVEQMESTEGEKSLALLDTEDGDPEPDLVPSLSRDDMAVSSPSTSAGLEKEAKESGADGQTRSESTAVTETDSVDDAQVADTPILEKMAVTQSFMPSPLGALSTIASSPSPSLSSVHTAEYDPDVRPGFLFLSEEEDGEREEEKERGHEKREEEEEEEEGEEEEEEEEVEENMELDMEKVGGWGKELDIMAPVESPSSISISPPPVQSPSSLSISPPPVQSPSSLSISPPPVQSPSSPSISPPPGDAEEEESSGAAPQRKRALSGDSVTDGQREEGEKEEVLEREEKRPRVEEEVLETQLELKISGRVECRHRLEKMVQLLVAEHLRLLHLTVFDKNLQELRERVEKIDRAIKHQNTTAYGLKARITRLSRIFRAANQVRGVAKKPQQVASFPCSPATLTTTPAALMPTVTANATPPHPDNTTPSPPDNTTPSPAANTTPVPAANTTPVPAANTTPVPAANTTPVPAANTTPVPAANTTPVPAANTTPVPAANTTPVPAANTTPVPAANTTPVPAANTTPVPAANTTPSHAAKTTPLPAANTTPSPAANTTPVPAANTTPVPAANTPPTYRGTVRSLLDKMTKRGTPILPKIASGPPSSAPVLPLTASGPALPAVAVARPAPHTRVLRPASLSGPPVLCQPPVALQPLLIQLPLTVANAPGAAIVNAVANPNPRLIPVSSLAEALNKTCPARTTAINTDAFFLPAPAAPPATSLFALPHVTVVCTVAGTHAGGGGVCVTSAFGVTSTTSTPPGTTVPEGTKTTASAPDAYATNHSTNSTAPKTPAKPNTSETVIDLTEEDEEEDDYEVMEVETSLFRPVSKGAAVSVSFSPAATGPPQKSNTTALKIQAGQRDVSAKSSPLRSHNSATRPPLSAHHHPPQQGSPSKTPASSSCTPQASIPPLLPLPTHAADCLPPEAAQTSTPQRPRLRLARLPSQNGIVLSWSVTEVDVGTCAKVHSYHLYAYYQDRSDPVASTGYSAMSGWKKIGEVKAIPLPMACTLTQFLPGSKYYFAVCAVDVYGRHGPFCEPQCIDLSSSS